MNEQAEFAAALLQGHCPPGLHTWNNSAAEQRFAVYRNNYLVGLIEALADTFTVTQALVGVAFFQAMARVFVQTQPAQSPLLVGYGEGFGEFIDSFPPAAGLPYLGADAPVVAASELARWLDDGDALSRLRLTLHPSVQLVSSAYAVVSLWAAHQHDDPAEQLAAINLHSAQAAMLIRQGLEVLVIPISPASAQLIANLRQQSLATAAATASPEALTATLALLVQHAAISQLSLQE
mgnify:CR=1 FL=1